MGKDKRKFLKNLLEDPHVKSWRSLFTAFSSIFSYLEKGLKKDGISVSRFQILFLLYFDGPMNAIEIVKKMFVTRGNISTFLKRLEKDKYVKVSQKTTNKSRPYYELTARSKKVFENVLPKHIQRVKEKVPAFDIGMIKIVEKLIDLQFSSKI